MFGTDIAIDLGTANVCVFVKGKGLVMMEPSVVARNRTTKKIIKIGKEAQEMLGRTPDNIVAVRPLRDGVISDFDSTEEMLRYFIKKACGRSIFRTRVIVCIPCKVTDVEYRAVCDAVRNTGAKDVKIIEEPLAAAIGAGLEIGGPVGNFVVDIGGGTTDAAVISLGSIVDSESVKIAGDKFDDSIVKYLRKKYNILVGDRTAEEVKRKIGCVLPREEKLTMTVKGRCLLTGLPKTIEVTSDETTEAFSEPTAAILDIVHNLFSRTPPELVGDILLNGVYLTGGGALIYGLDKAIENRIGVPVHLADEPELCVVKGTGAALDTYFDLDD